MLAITNHWTNRTSRNEFIKNEIGLGNVIRTFRCDRGHPNGPELHTLTDTGVVIVRNERTNKLITTLIARPGQIKRYYINENEQPPTYLLDIAYEHAKAGYNQM